jgi:hypothetical protein
VFADRAVFESDSGEQLVMKDVERVSQPSRSELRRQRDLTWMTNTWIAVHFKTGHEDQLAYFNSARTLGHYLPHRRMLQALQGLVAIQTDS